MTTAGQTQPADIVGSELLGDVLALGAALRDSMESYSADDTPDVTRALVPEGYVLVSTVREDDLSRMRSTPRRVTGTATVTDAASWLAYFAKHGCEHSEVFGDVTASTITAVLNAPADADAPSWGDHRLVLALKHSPAWTAWVKLSGEFLSQTAFAEHIEDRAPDLVHPDAATMLEVAQSIKATTGVKFESGARLHDRQRRFSYMETVEGKAGERGQLDIPTELNIKVQVWRGVPIVVEMTARFRYRAAPSGLLMGYVLDRIDDKVDAAWQSLLGDLTGELPVPVLAGQAPWYDR